MSSYNLRSKDSTKSKSKSPTITKLKEILKTTEKRTQELRDNFYRSLSAQRQSNQTSNLLTPPSNAPTSYKQREDDTVPRTLHFSPEEYSSAPPVIHRDNDRTPIRSHHDVITATSTDFTSTPLHIPVFQSSTDRDENLDDVSFGRSSLGSHIGRSGIGANKGPTVSDDRTKRDPPIVGQSYNPIFGHSDVRKSDNKQSVNNVNPEQLLSSAPTMSHSCMQGNFSSPNKVIKLTPYSGKDSESFTSFLTRFDKFCNLNNIPNEQKNDVLNFYLEGAAQTYFDNLSEEIKSDFHEVVNALSKRFQTNDLDYNLISIKQKPLESAEEYLTRGLKIATDLKLDEKILVSLLVNGLQDNIKLQIIMKEPKTLSELSKFIKLSEMTNSLSVNSLESKFQGLSDEIKNLKDGMMPRENCMLINSRDPPRTAYNYRTSVPLQYQRPRVVNRLTNNPRLKNSNQPQTNTNPCYRCGNRLTPYHRCHAVNKQCTYCKRMGHFQKMCIFAKH